MIGRLWLSICALALVVGVGFGVVLYFDKADSYERKVGKKERQLGALRFSKENTFCSRNDWGELQVFRLKPGKVLSAEQQRGKVPWVDCRASLRTELLKIKQEQKPEPVLGWTLAWVALVFGVWRWGVWIARGRKGQEGDK